MPIVLQMYHRNCTTLTESKSVQIYRFVINLNGNNANAGFGEASPEAKAANHLHKFFTYIAVRIVSAQLEVRFGNSHLDLFIS